MVCAFVFHNYVNLVVGLKLTLGQEVRILSGWPASHLAANLTSPSLSNFGKVDLRVGILPGIVGARLGRLAHGHAGKHRLEAGLNSSLP